MISTRRLPLLFGWLCGGYGDDIGGVLPLGEVVAPDRPGDYTRPGDMIASGPDVRVRAPSGCQGTAQKIGLAIGQIRP